MCEEETILVEEPNIIKDEIYRRFSIKNTRKKEAVVIGKRIRVVRKELHMTQKEFSKVLEVGYTRIGNYERGERNMPSSDVLKKLCKKFGINLSWLITGEGEMYNNGLYFVGKFIKNCMGKTKQQQEIEKFKKKIYLETIIEERCYFLDFLESLSNLCLEIVKQIRIENKNIEEKKK